MVRTSEPLALGASHAPNPKYLYLLDTFNRGGRYVASVGNVIAYVVADFPFQNIIDTGSIVCMIS